MLRHLFLIVPFLFLVHVSSASALPPCDENYSGHCYGTYTFTSGPHSGDKYVGEIRAGKWHGQGTYTYADGDVYVGEHRDGRRHGPGTFTWANGDKYVGELEEDLFHGQGTLTFTDGEKYVGEFRNHQKHGYGSLLLSNTDATTFSGRSIHGLEVVGDFVEDHPEGNVTLYWPNGDVWVGRVRGLDWLGGNKYTAGNVPPEVYGENTAPTPPSYSTPMDKAKSQCEELGFLPKTEKYGDCVLKLLEMN